MTIFGFLCGSSVAPPKSPGPSGPNNQREDPAASNISKHQDDSTSVGICQEDKATVLVKTTSGGTSIDCSALMDKAASPTQSDKNKHVSFQMVTKGEEEDGFVAEDTADAEEGADDSELVQVFGFDTLNQLRSKAWDDRTRALQLIRERVEGDDLGSATATELYVASTSAAKVLLADRVMPVYLGALELSRLLVVDFAAKHELPREVVEQQAAKLVPMIVDKTSDRNTRSTEATHAVIMAMAKALGARCVMVHVLPHGMEPVSNAKETAAIRGRLEVVENHRHLWHQQELRRLALGSDGLGAQSPRGCR